MNKRIARIGFIIILIIGVLIVNYHQRHDFLYSIQHARTITITLPDNQTTYYLSKQINPDVFAAFKHGRLRGSTSASAPMNTCVVMIYVDDGKIYPSDQIAIKNIKGIKAYYWPGEGYLFQDTKDAAFLSNRSIYCTNDIAHSWLMKRVPEYIPPSKNLKMPENKTITK